MTQDDLELDDNELHIAVRLGDIEATKTALKQGYDPDTIGLFEWSALHEAAYNGNVEIVQILLNHGSDPNKPDYVSANTPLHYACSEEHAACLDVLIKNGGKPDKKNQNGEDCYALASDAECLKVIEQHGYGQKQKLTKIFPKTSQKEEPKVQTITKPKISSSPNRASDIGSKARFAAPKHSESTDSGLASPTQQSPILKRSAWNDRKSDHGIASPVRSIGSSYGSLTSLGSSSCSTADDNAGEFVMSFRYNSKKQEFKLCLWEIRLISLIPASQMPKGTNIHLYLKSTIIPSDEFGPNPILQRKSDTIHLFPGEHNASGNHSMVAKWLEREAKLEFKNPITLEYKDVSKHLVTSSAIQVCLCVRPKRSIIGNKSKKTPHDPVLATHELKMTDAVKRLMKESYETERHDVLGLTRQAMPLEDIIAHRGVENPSFYSDPNVRIHMSSIQDSNHHELRCASDGDLQKSHTHKKSSLPEHGAYSDRDITDNDEKPKRKNSHVSLEGVSTHVAPSTKQKHIKVPVFSISESLEMMEIKTHRNSSNNQNAKVEMPQFNSGYYNTPGHHTQSRGRSPHPHTKHKRNKLLAAAAENVHHLDTSVVRAIDNEESSVGSPSESIISDFDEPITPQVYTHQRANSSSSFSRVDESPSPARRRNPHTYSSPKHTRQLTVPQSTSSKGAHKDWALEMDPRDKQVNVELRGTAKHSGNTIEMKTLRPSSKEKSRSRTTYNDTGLKSRRVHLGSETQRQLAKEHALRKLIYDESDLTDVLPNSSANPCFVYD